MPVTDSDYHDPSSCDLDSQSLAKVENFDEKIEFVIDAVYSLAFAIHNMWLNVCRPYEQYNRNGICPEMDTFDRNLFGKRLYKDFLMNVNFTGLIIPKASLNGGQ